MAESTEIEVPIADLHFAQSILDSLGGNVALLSNDGVIVMTNQDWESYNQENSALPFDSIGKNYFEICKNTTGPEMVYAQMALQGCLDVIDQKIPHFEMQYPCHSPTEDMWYMIKAMPFKHSMGGILIVHKKLNDKLSVQQKVEESESRFSSLAERTPIMIWMTDTQDQILYINQKFLDYTQKSKDNFIQTPLLDILIPEDAQVVCPLLSSHEKKGFETVVRLKDASKNQFFLLQGNPRYSKSGAFIGHVGTITDISELTRTKSELEKSLKEVSNYKFALDQYAMISMTDRNGIIIEVNDRFCQISQYNAHEIIGGKHNIIDSGYHDRPFFEEMKATVHSGHIWRGEILNKAKDGTFFWVDATIVPLDEKMLSHRFLSIYLDITEKKNAELKLLKANNLFLQACDIGKIGGWEFDIETQTPIFSSQMFEIYGLPEETHLNEEIWMKPFHEKDWPRINFNVNRCVTDGIPWREEYEFTSYTGQMLWIQTVGRRILTENQPPKLLGIFQDITEIKKMQLDLLQSNDLLKETGRLAKVGGWSYDLKTKEITWTDLVYEFFDLPKDATITSELILSPLSEKDKAILNECNRLAIETGKTYENIFEFKNKQGELLKTKNIVKCIFVDGEPTRLMGVFQDITQQIEREHERNKLLEDLETRNKNLSQFNYIVSHNLRAPVANILGLSNLLSQQSLDESTGHLVDLLVDSTSKLDEMIKDLNQILSMKEVAIEKSFVSLKDVCRTVTTSLAKQIHDVEAEIDIDFTELNEVYSVKAYVQSILYNFISNSLKYRNPKQHPIIRIKSQKHADFWSVSVEDNGLGIDLTKNKEKVFGLYKRFHYHVEGKGLGLYLVKTQVEALGGSIDVKSELGIGTIFQVNIPLG